LRIIIIIEHYIFIKQYFIWGGLAPTCHII
jgi:hypothetical protein